MITKSVSEARRHLGDLIELAREGQEVVIIKDSRPAVALVPVEDSDLELATTLTDHQARRIWEMVRTEPRKTFASAEQAVKHLKKRTSGTR